MDLDGARKRERTETALNGNGGFKKSKPEMDSLSTGLGSKSRPCTKFFSTSGCPFGEGCHFAHYVPGGVKSISQMISPALPPGIRNPAPPQSFPDGVPPAVKTRLCNKFNSAEGCRFGDKCYYAHGEWELGRPNPPQDHGGMGPGPMQQPRMGGGWNAPPPPPNHGPAASFGASATAKISVDASLAGPIIGKNGINSKNICRMTGARLSIKEHESDPNLKNIELEGTFDQINLASSMVRELIANVGAASANNAMKQHQHQHQHHSGMQQSSGSANNFKTKLCANFTKGACTFRERCHFAHGESELRKPGM